MNSSKLIVEGQTDTLFFAALLQKIALSVEIKPHHGITKIPDLLTAYFDDLQDGTIKRLGIVADADYITPKGQGGFNKRWQLLTNPLRKMGYEINIPPSQPYTGSIFTHAEELPPIGLWLMPDHQSDGMLEDLIKQTVYGDRQLSLLQTATTCLEQLPITLFQPHHHTKATVYSWLAWQTRPGQALVSTINANLINLHSPEMQAFFQWLREVFQ
jgi:hypothetical protein